MGGAGEFSWLMCWVCGPGHGYPKEEVFTLLLTDTRVTKCSEAQRMSMMVIDFLLKSGMGNEESIDGCGQPGVAVAVCKHRYLCHL